ncbi:MAG: ATP-binding protein [Verrucomicrobiota bacterium]|nr:ATP-binding protein [Verrucomicrobiota bacterium]
MKSIRQYLRNRIISGSAAILATGSVLIALAIRQLDILEFDATLEAKARMLATLVLREDRKIEVDFAGEFMPEFETGGDTEYFQLRLLDGSVIERSDMLGERNLPFLPHAVRTPVFRNLRLPDGRPGRFVQIVFPPRSAGPEKAIQNGDRFQIPQGTDPDTALFVFAVARSRMGLDALLRRVYFTLAAVDVLLVGLIALLVRGTLRKGLQPLSDINRQIARLGPEALDQRVHLPDAPAEIVMFPITVNSVMEALHAAFVRERRFTSDVAHELRTPVAEFRAACEVGAKWSDDPALVRRRFDNLRESAVNMERMLEGLLDLNRLDQGAVRIGSTVTAIAALVDSSWECVCSSDVGSGRRLENNIDWSLHLNTDPLKLRQIIFNLLSNAVWYSPPGSAVICTSIRACDGKLELRFSNHTDALEQEDLHHIFERFWRKDAERTGGIHSGLGLSIVQALADALGIEVVTDLTADKVFTASLRFPVQGAV